MNYKAIVHGTSNAALAVGGDLRRRNPVLELFGTPHTSRENFVKVLVGNL
jgi:hypothetical protein